MSDRYLIVGGGVSGVAAAKYLQHMGHHVRISEKNPLLQSQREELKKLGIDVQDRGHEPKHLIGIQKVVVSPGISPEQEFLRRAKKQGLEFTTEVEIGLQNFFGKVISVTGTNGKSTVVAMIEHLSQGNGIACGNFGLPVVEATRLHPSTLALELSSYQLEWMPKVHADVAICTSFASDHLSRHKTLEAYLRCKWKIFDRRTPPSLCLIHEDALQAAKKFQLPIPQNTEVVSRNSPEFLNLRSTIRKNLQCAGVFGEHNLINAYFALRSLNFLFSLGFESLLSHLRDYAGLPFRCQQIGSCRSFPIINDSKSTNLESTLAALKDHKVPIILILGGQSKGESFTNLLSQSKNIKEIWAFGACVDIISKELKDRIPMQCFSSLKALFDYFQPNDVVAPLLFSPGCASFDEFANYKERGLFFNQSLQKYLD